MRPSPITPSVLPHSSWPRSSFLAQRPCLSSRSARARCRAQATMAPRVSSATLTELPPGVLTTTTPRAVAACRSMLSTPLPARPTTRSRGAAASSSAVTCVPERTIQPSQSATAAASCSGLLPSRTSTSISGSARSRSSPCSASGSLIKTRMDSASPFVVRGRRCRSRSNYSECRRNRPSSSAPGWNAATEKQLDSGDSMSKMRLTRRCHDGCCADHALDRCP